MKTFKQYNESLRAKMTPKPKDSIRDGLLEYFEEYCKVHDTVEEEFSKLAFKNPKDLELCSSIFTQLYLIDDGQDYFYEISKYYTEVLANAKSIDMKMGENESFLCIPDSRVAYYFDGVITESWFFDISIMDNIIDILIESDLNESIRDKMTPKSKEHIRKVMKELPAKQVLSSSKAYDIKLTDGEIRKLVKKLSPKDVLTSPREFGIKLSDEEKLNALKKLKPNDYNELVDDEIRSSDIKRGTNRNNVDRTSKKNVARWVVIEKRLKELKSPHETAEEILNMSEEEQLKELGYDIETMIPLSKFFTGINYGFLWLIQQGLDSGEVNIDCMNGHALDVAVTKEDEEMVELLLRNGADVNKRDYLHKNQQKHRNKRIEELLYQYGDN